MAEHDDDDTVVSFENLCLKLDNSEDARPIVEKMKSHKNMSCLRLSGNTLGIAPAEVIGQQLEKHPKLEKCIFSDLFTGRLKTEIAPALRHLSGGIMASNAHLVELDLSDNAFGPNGVVGITELLSSPSCFTLEILKMNNQGLGDAGCKQLSEALKKGREASRGSGLKLKVFWGGRNRLENVGARELAEVFSDMGSLEELVLYQNGIGINGVDGVQKLAEAISKNPNLRILNLSDNTLTAKGAEALAAVLPSLTQLEELYLGDCILRSAGAKYIAKALAMKSCTPLLRELHLTGNEIRRDIGIRLVLSLVDKRHLQRLDLNTNEFGPSGVEAVIQALDSVDLARTLMIPEPGEDDSSSPEIIDAFNDDQGTDNEEEEEEEGEAEEYDDEGSEDEDKEDHGVRNDVEKAAPMPGFHNNDSTPNRQVATKQMSAGDFSFKSVFESLHQSPPTTTFCAGSCTNTTSLFDAVLTNGANSKPAALFSWTPANHKSPTPAATFNISTSKMPDSSAESLTTLLVTQLTLGAKDKLVFKRLHTALSSDSSVGVTESVARDCVAEAQASPEAVVRLALRLIRSSIGTVDSPLARSGDALLMLALTEEVGTAPDGGGGGGAGDYGLSSMSRATNCLLVHLGAIKRERGVDEDVETGVGDEENACPGERQGELVCLSAVRRVVEAAGPRLPTGVVNALSILLSEQKARLTVDSLAKAQPQAAVTMLDEIVESLEGQLDRLKLGAT